MAYSFIVHEFIILWKALLYWESSLAAGMYGMVCSYFNRRAQGQSEVGIIFNIYSQWVPSASQSWVKMVQQLPQYIDSCKTRFKHMRLWKLCYTLTKQYLLVSAKSLQLLMMLRWEKQSAKLGNLVSSLPPVMSVQICLASTSMP